LDQAAARSQFFGQPSGLILCLFELAESSIQTRKGESARTLISVDEAGATNSRTFSLKALGSLFEHIRFAGYGSYMCTGRRYGAALFFTTWHK
jgi:hypothetical protein